MPDPAAARTPIPERFRAACRARGIEPDPSQLSAARRMQRLYQELMAFKHARRTPLRKLLVHPAVPRGIYLWGEVGRGKSLLMNFFHEVLPYRRKRRVHFHAFMREVHESLRRLRHEADPLLAVGERIARETRFLCFDEFHVSDIADAMILGRLIEALIGRVAAQGTTVLLVTHDAGQVRRLADRALFLHAGRVTEDAPAARLLSDPQSPQAQAYLAGRLLL